VLAAHRDVDALDLAGAAPEAEAELEVAAADNVKRVLRRRRSAWTGPPSQARRGWFFSPRSRPSGTPSASSAGRGQAERPRRLAKLGVQVVDHPLAKALLAQLRDRNTPPPLFRLLAKRLALVLCLEATRGVPTAPVEVETPLTRTTGARLAKPWWPCPCCGPGSGCWRR